MQPQAGRGGPGKGQERDRTTRSRPGGIGSIAVMEIPTETAEGPRWSHSAQRGPDTETTATKAGTPQRTEEGPRKRRSDLAKPARRRWTCGMKLSWAVVPDLGDLGSLVLNDLDPLERLN